MTQHRPSISLVGLGYVGLCTAAAFASRGFNTVGVDIDTDRIAMIRAGQTPVHEPRLDGMLKRAMRTHRLKVTEDLSSISKTDVIFITVGTPSNPDGSINLRYVESAARQIGTALRGESDYRLAVVKSTVTPGTTSSIVKPILEENSEKIVGAQLGLCTNPEFLSEGRAIHDAFHPDKIVIGASDKKSAVRLKRLYHTFYAGKLPPIVMTTPETSEMIKYASNSFLATKVTYINTIANIAQQIPGVDVEKVAQTIGLDPRIGPLFLKAGPGYGGSCFHKDVQALVAFGKKHGFNPSLLSSVEEVNERQATKVVELAERLVGSLNGRRVAILGLAFKKDTDDIREASSIRVIEQLRKKGARVVAYDPMAMRNARQVLGDGVEFASDAKSAISKSDCCLVLTEWDEFRKLRAKDYVQHMGSPNLVDARRIYRPQDLEGLNFLAVGLGPVVGKNPLRMTEIP